MTGKVAYSDMLPDKPDFTQSFPCSLLVYQFYKHRGFDAVFMKLFKNYAQINSVSSKELPSHYNKILHVPVSRNKAYRGSYCMSIDALIEMNQAIELYIRDIIRYCFLEDMESARRNDVKFKIKAFIDSILERLGLSEEAKTFDAVKKDLQRFCAAQGIDYSDAKKVRKAVPKVTSTCQLCQHDGVLLPQFLEYMGVSRQAFYKYHISKYRTFKYRGRVYVHLDSIDKAAVSFVVPYGK